MMVVGTRGRSWNVSGTTVTNKGLDCDMTCPEPRTPAPSMAPSPQTKSTLPRCRRCPSTSKVPLLQRLGLGPQTRSGWADDGKL